MKRYLAAALVCVMCLLLCSCAEDNSAQLEEYALQVQKLEQSLQTVTQQRDELSRQLSEVQTKLDAAQSEQESLEETVQALSAQVEELLYPPLQQSGTIRLFGVDEPVLTDGQTEYLHFDRFVQGSGLDLQEDSFTLREWEGENYVKLSQAAQMENIVLDVTQDGIRFLAKAKNVGDLTPDVNVPVLMYHAVSDNMWGIEELFVSPSEMEKQLAWLVENEYDPIWFEDLSHLEDYDKPVILTFDDGYDDNYEQLYPLLQKYGVKATIFVIGNAFGTNHKMTAEQIRELSGSGLVSIQSHGYTHKDMNVMDEKTLEYELGESQRVIAAVTGEMPYVLCYPSGKHSDLTVQVAERYYSIALKMNGGLYNTDDDPFRVNRYYVSRYTDIYTFGAYCAAGQ